jgi:hypothetical protein
MQKITRRIEVAMRAILPQGIEVDFTPLDRVTVKMILSTHEIRIKWIGEGWLGQVRPVLKEPNLPDVVVARRMSPGAREALADENIGWVDELGAAEIAVGSIIVSRSGRPAPKPEKPKRWTPTVLAVAEALLCGHKPTVSETYDATGLSWGSCTNALRVLEDLNLISSTAARGRGSARQIVDVEAFLDEYVLACTALATNKKLVAGLSLRDPVEELVKIGRKWNELNVNWAASGAVAATVLAPILTNVSSAEVYVDGHTITELELIAGQADLLPIEGGRLTLKAFPTSAMGRLSTIQDGLKIAPWPRVYADLRKIGVRGEEAAEHLREVMRAR